MSNTPDLYTKFANIIFGVKITALCVNDNFKQSTEQMKIERENGKEYLFIKGGLIKGIMHRTEITPELVKVIKKEIKRKVK